MNIKNIIKVGSLSMTLLFGACDKFFDVQPGDMLLEKDSYSSLNQVYANFLGISISLQKAAEQYIIMSELQGDLMEPTANAPTEFWEAWRYEASNSNSIVDPTPFYNVIVQTNDFLRHVVKFNRENPNIIEKNIYTGMIASAVTARVWSYLNIGKFYGEALYYDISLSSDIDLSKQKMLQFDQLIDELIHLINNGVDGVSPYQTLDWTRILNNEDYSWNRMTINPDALMAEMYLWKGNYLDAARQIIRLISGKSSMGISATDGKFRLNSTFSKNKWKDLFTKNYSDLTAETLSFVPYDFSKNQTNNLQYWFSNMGANVYYLKPTDTLISKYENTVCLDKTIGDSYRGKDVTYSEIGKDMVIQRYSLGKSTYSHDAFIYLYRAAEMYLMLSEALNGMGDIVAADSILNVGLASSWDGKKLLPPFDIPMFTASDNLLKDCLGVRGRAGVKPKFLRDFVAEDAPMERKQFVLDSLIAEETALEHAFEGKRWFTLMRMARNNNRPAFLADQVVKKFPIGERAQYHILLMNPQNWFIKYDQLHVIE